MPNTKAKYRVGGIGVGRAGTSRIRAFELGGLGEVVAIADTDPDNLALGKGRFQCNAYSTFDEMFAKEKIDIAVPVLPVRPNADAVVAAAKHGVKALFCEKPLTAKLSEADRMVNECASRGIPLVCGIVVSSHPDYQKAYAMAAGGEIGEIVRINNYETNGQMGTHGLNLVRKFAGKSDVDFVIGWCSGDPNSDYEEDYGDGKQGYGWLGGYIRFKNGIECFSGYRPERGLGWKGIEIVGTKGIMFNPNNTGLGWQMFRAAAGASPKSFADLQEVKGVFKPKKDDDEGRAYDDEGWRHPGEVMMHIVDEMYAYLEHGKPIGASTGDDMRHALEIAIALRQSARQGNMPVKFPILDRTLAAYPEKSRWHYKKTIMGSEAYMAQLAQQVKSK